MIENIPRSVIRCITASARDITDSIRETGGVPNSQINAFAANIEKFMLGMVGGVFPKTKSEWVDKTASYAATNRTAAPNPAEADAVAAKVKKERETIREWVANNATKEMYESLIGGVDSLVNVLKQKYDNDDTGEFSAQYPDLAASLGGDSALEPSEPTKTPEKSQAVSGPAASSKTDDSEIPGDLQALLDSKLEDAGSEMPDLGDEPAAAPQEQEGGQEETPEGYTGGMFDKPRKGPAPAGQTTPRNQNMDEFNTPAQELARKKPGAAPGHKI